MSMEQKSDKNTKLVLKEIKDLKCMAGLSPEALEFLAGAGILRTFKAGNFVWEAGEPGEFIAVVVSGLLEITRHSHQDDEMCMGVFGPSDVLGLSAVMKKTPYPGNARILTTPTVIVKVYLRTLLQSKDPHSTEIQTWIREMVLRHEQILRDKIDMLGAGRIEDRVFELVNHLIRRFGQQEGSLKYRVPIGMTRAQVGRLVDGRVETIIRLINRWQRAGFLIWNKEGIVIENLSMLEKSLHSNKKYK